MIEIFLKVLSNPKLRRNIVKSLYITCVKFLYLCDTFVV